jgi:NitT/TauT family transport system substrate-binding protein
MLKISVLLIFTLLLGCSEPQDDRVRIGINPWPGYELLYLADSLGLYKQAGLNVDIVQLSSLADTQRAFLQERLDGMASTLIEASVAASRSPQPLLLGLVTDYSSGADVIIAGKGLASMQALRGKTVGAELQSLGVMLLARALARNQMNFSDIHLRNVEQSQVQQAMLDNKVQAVVSYPPESLKLLADVRHKVVFSSREIPNEIIDVVVFRQGYLIDDVWLRKFRMVWQQAYDYWQSHPVEAARLMAAREGLSEDEFQEALLGLEILSDKQQGALISERSHLIENIMSTCSVLRDVVAMAIDCERVKTNLIIPSI